ncbi:MULTISPECIES: FtsH protease activity modulator HflK [Candidatus Ichthyocystis]|uniref:FtsH protease activity modulator HflK n=1 Tax=Candidatus Ichthyocystis TaxID=2929841 RepID=UPI000A6BA863|nr:MULTISPECIES: FtsH protease activity modulator HflK [Ichthyocystis]
MKFVQGVRFLLNIIFNQQTPPDLEQVWQDFLNKLKSLFGVKTPTKKYNFNDNRQPPSPSEGGFPFTFVVVFVLIIVIWLLSGLYIVGASQQAVELRFGKYTQTLGPGLHWHWPFPIESREVYEVTNVRTVQLGYHDTPDNLDKEEATMLTDDENIVNIQFSVQYSVRDVRKFAFNNSSTPDEWVRKASESAMREVVGRHVMDYVLYGGRADISDLCQSLIQSILDRYGTGIQIIKVNLQNAQPPEQVQDAFSDAVKAVQDKERQKNEGQTYANSVIPRAKGDASRIIQMAEGYKQRVVSMAKGDSSRFSQILEAYRRNPKITEDRIYLDSMEKILKNSSKLYISSHSNQNVFYLPLDKIMSPKVNSSLPSVDETTPSTPPKPVSSASRTDSSKEDLTYHKQGDPMSSLLGTRERGGR